MLAMSHEPPPELLGAYADLLVKVGVNVQPGQKLMIRAPLCAAPLVRKCTEIAYRLGSPFVDVFWNDEMVSRERFLHAPAGSFEIVPKHRADGMIALAEEGAASLAIVGDDPDALRGVDAAAHATYMKAWRTASKPYSEYTMRDAIPWTVAAAASPAWARRVFPDLAEEEALAALWSAIFHVTRIDLDDPVAAWRQHSRELQGRRDVLNARRFDALHLRGPGTDLRVGLAEDHLWDGGGSTSEAGIDFIANMPTEEVFTAPHCRRVDGVVRSSMPLSYNGQMIEDIELHFAAGSVTGSSASKGAQALEGILRTDLGARRLGEIALVPVSSPIAKMGLLFYETLFDENAASHLALGHAYPTNLAGGRTLAAEQRADKGLNESLVHVDFMIGSNQLDVDGIAADGTTTPVMRAGAWTL